MTRSDAPDDTASRSITDRRSGVLWRLRERGVVRVAASYAVIAWLLLQIADVIFEPLGVPRWVMIALIAAAVLGFPVAIALAWHFELGDHGLERDMSADSTARPVSTGCAATPTSRSSACCSSQWRRCSFGSRTSGGRRARLTRRSPSCRSRTWAVIQNRSTSPTAWPKKCSTASDAYPVSSSWRAPPRSASRARDSMQRRLPNDSVQPPYSKAASDATDSGSS